MAFEFRLPDIGEGLVEGEIVKWLVKEGDQVEEDQPLVEVMTDKATVEIPSPRKGTIQKLLADEGETVAVEAPIIVIDEADGSGNTSTTAKPAAATTNHQTTAKQPTAATPTAISGVAAISKVLATPAVRKEAKDMGLNLSLVQGSGPGGRIRLEDLGDGETLTVDDLATTAAKNVAPSTAATTGPKNSSPPAASKQTAAAVTPTRIATDGDITEIPLRGLRKRIAAQMVTSKQHAPHYTYVDEIDMTRIVENRRAMKGLMDEKGIKVNFIPFIIQALIPAFKKFPLVNAALDEERGVIIQKNFYNIGIAVATEDGLMVPVIKDADKLSIWQLASEVKRLADDANRRRPKQEDLKDSTFTVTSIGNLGGIITTPIINYPEVAILGINQIKERPVVRDGQIVVRHMTYLSISCDHRVVDGALAAEFMNEVKGYLETPERFLMA